MGTVDNNFDVLQTWNKSTGEDEWDNGQLRPRYDRYQWRDYYRNKIGGDPPRYQLWKNDRWGYETFVRASMEADKQNMITAALAAEKRVSERAAAKANAW